MDGTLTLIFAKSETTEDIITKLSAFLQLRSGATKLDVQGVQLNIHF